MLPERFANLLELYKQGTITRSELEELQDALEREF